MKNSRSGSIKPSNIVFRGQSKIMQQHFGMQRLRASQSSMKEPKESSGKRQVKSPKLVTNLILNDKISQMSILAKLQDLQQQQEQLQRQLIQGKIVTDPAQASSEILVAPTEAYQPSTTKRKDIDADEILIQNQQRKTAVGAADVPDSAKAAKK